MQRIIYIADGRIEERKLLYNARQDEFEADHFQNRCVGDDGARLVVYQTVNGDIYEINRPDGAIYDDKFYYTNFAAQAMDKKASIKVINFRTKKEILFEYDESYNPRSCLHVLCRSYPARDIFVSRSKRGQYFLETNLGNRYSYFRNSKSKSSHKSKQLINRILCFEID